MNSCLDVLKHLLSQVFLDNVPVMRVCSDKMDQVSSLFIFWRSYIKTSRAKANISCTFLICFLLDQFTLLVVSLSWILHCVEKSVWVLWLKHGLNFCCYQSQYLCVISDVCWDWWTGRREVLFVCLFIEFQTLWKFLWNNSFNWE